MRPVKAKWSRLPEKSEFIPRAGFASIDRRTMSKEVPLSLAERDFILESLKENVRLDGRQADQLRPLKISFGEEYGHVKLQLGKTRLVYLQHGWRGLD